MVLAFDHHGRILELSGGEWIEIDPCDDDIGAELLEYATARWSGRTAVLPAARTAMWHGIARELDVDCVVASTAQLLHEDGHPMWDCFATAAALYNTTPTVTPVEVAAAFTVAQPYATQAGLLASRRVMRDHGWESVVVAGAELWVRDGDVTEARRYCG